MYIIYGIPNCNTVKSTRDWFKRHDIDYSFYDYKKSGVSVEKLQEWCKQKGWEILLNKKGTTWRALDILQQKKICNEKTAIAFFIANTSVIRRPIIELDGKIITIGFDENSYTLLFHH
jgi:arsenate reductase (glutaredoxin)